MLYSLWKLGIEFSTEHLEITENADIIKNEKIKNQKKKKKKKKKKKN